MAGLESDDFIFSAEEMLKHIFTNCDVSKEGQQNASKLINYINDLLKVLQTQLDPDDTDPLVDCDLFCKISKACISKLSCKLNLRKLDAGCSHNVSWYNKYLLINNYKSATTGPNGSFYWDTHDEVEFVLLPGDITFSQTINDLRKGNQNALKEKVSSLLFRTNASSTEINDLKRRLEVMEEENKNRLSKENKKLTSYLNLYTELKEENKKLVNKIDELNKLHSSSRKQYDIVKKSLKCSEQTNTQLNRKLSEAQMKIQNLDEKLQEERKTNLKYNTLLISYIDASARFEEQVNIIKYYIEDNKRIQAEKNHLEEILRHHLNDEQNLLAIKCSHEHQIDHSEKCKNNSNDKKKSKFTPAIDIYKLNFVNCDSPIVQSIDDPFNTPKLLRQLASPITPFAGNSFTASTPHAKTYLKNNQSQHKIKLLESVQEESIVQDNSEPSAKHGLAVKSREEEKCEKHGALKHEIHTSNIYKSHKSLHDEISQVADVSFRDTCKKSQSTQIDEIFIKEKQKNPILKLNLNLANAPKEKFRVMHKNTELESIKANMEAEEDKQKFTN